MSLTEVLLLLLFMVVYQFCYIEKNVVIRGIIIIKVSANCGTFLHH